jgi:hypothetical protein
MKMKKGKPTTDQRRAFVLSLRDAGLSYEEIAAEAIKKFGKQNLPSWYNKRLACLDLQRELDTKSSKKLNLVQRNNKIFKYRMAGMSYQQILHKLIDEFGKQNLPQGYCERHICRDLKRYLKKIEAENRQELIETKNLYRERLNFLLNILWEKASQGDFQAIDRVLIITKTLSKLDGMEQVTPAVASPTDVTFSSFADIGEHLIKLNVKGNGNGNNDE